MVRTSTPPPKPKCDDKTYVYFTCVYEMINEYPSILYYTIPYYPSYLLLKTLLVLRNLCERKKMENCELHVERVVLFVSRLRQAIFFFSLLFSQLYCHIFLVGYKGAEMEALEKRDNQLRLERRESR